MVVLSFIRTFEKDNSIHLTISLVVIFLSSQTHSMSQVCLYDWLTQNAPLCLDLLSQLCADDFSTDIYLTDFHLSCLSFHQHSILHGTCACFHTPHTVSVSHLVPTFGLWFLWPSASEIAGPWMVLIKDLIWFRSSLLSQEHVHSTKMWPRGKAACLKWKWGLLLPLPATTNTHCGNSPPNLSVWIDSKVSLYRAEGCHL